MNKFFLKTIIIVVLTFLILSAVSSVQAAKLYYRGDIIDPAGKTAASSGYNYSDSSIPNNLSQSVGLIIQAVLSFLGVIFFVIIIYAGFLWMTAQGNEEQLTKAKSLLKNSVIGLLIVFSAYLISYIVISRLGSAAGYTTGLESTSTE